jgi:hypothetical protein
LAAPLNVSGAPGARITGWATVGGVTDTGAVMATDGAIPLVLTVHVRLTASRLELPPLSLARTSAVQSPSRGTVISLDHVVVSAPGTSTGMPKELYAADTEPSSCRYRPASSLTVRPTDSTPLSSVALPVTRKVRLRTGFAVVGRSPQARG